MATKSKDLKKKVEKVSTSTKAAPTKSTTKAGAEKKSATVPAKKGSIPKTTKEILANGLASKKSFELKSCFAQDKAEKKPQINGKPPQQVKPAPKVESSSDDS
ncbi:hypothetical protein FRC20_002408, partial [Serendipita sp. 405]